MNTSAKPKLPARFPRAARSRGGFALVVTLSLMVLLTVIAVGLLTLSGISLRTTSRIEVMQSARANAKLALMLALGDLQKQLGPDTRISAPSDQIAGVDPSVSSAPADQRHWTGVYQAWPAGDPSAPRPSPTFRQWLVSGDPTNTDRRDFAGTALGNSPADSVEIVTSNSTGAGGGSVRVPLVSQRHADGTMHRLGWWVSDEGTKAYVPSDPTPETEDTSRQRLALQAAPHYGLAVMKADDIMPFEKIDPQNPENRKLITFAQAGFAATSPQSIRPLYHDIATWNRGLLTNVRTGGFRKDLSMALQAPENAIPKTALYRVDGRDGINFAELWAYHNLWKELKSGAGGNYTTGGSIPSGSGFLQSATTQAAFAADKFYYQKQPAFIRFQTMLSFASTPVKNPNTGAVTYNLGVVLDPVVTLWNPLDVPLSLSGSWNSIKFWPIPYDIIITVNGVENRVPYRYIVGNAGNPQNLTMRTGTDNLILKPGEVMVFSQGSSTPTTYSTGQAQFINGKPGWNFGGGMFYEYRNNKLSSPKPLVSGPGNTSFSFRVEPNDSGAEGSQRWALNVHGVYFKEDRNHGGSRPKPDDAPGASNETLQTANYSIDSLTGQPFDSGGTKPNAKRIKASDANFLSFFNRIDSGADIQLSEINTGTGNKRPFMIFTYAAKTEVGPTDPGLFLARYNPRAANVDFFDIQSEELRMLPFDMQIRSLASRLDPVIDVSSQGNGYFGGGWKIDEGTRNVITHSVPRMAPVSLAAFQHSMANGFVPGSNGRVDNRRFLLPQISHAIGNSLAPSVIPPDATSATIDGPRPLADHSYLANQALWDDWFLSGISPQESPVFAASRDQKTVASDFLSGDRPLPVKFYKADLQGEKPETLLASWFSGSSAKAGAEASVAPHLSVEGMFNVNSTSVEAWKALLSGLRNHEVLAQSETGAESPIATNGTPVSSLQTPRDLQVDESSLADRSSPAQWSGVRSLGDAEIDELARAIVSQVRKRGPFISLADFVNRRIGSDRELAISGAIQSALDSPEVSINREFRTGDRAATGTSDGLPFPEAEQGAAAYGIPGYVKQADILTPIAPLLSARSDTFTIRGYGETLDRSGRVIARATCEATVQRGAEYVSPANSVTTLPAQLDAVNQVHGRRFEIISFRWLSPAEA